MFIFLREKNLNIACFFCTASVRSQSLDQPLVPGVLSTGTELSKSQCWTATLTTATTGGAHKLPGQKLDTLPLPFLIYSTLFNARYNHCPIRDHFTQF